MHETEKESGNLFMAKTAELIAKYPAATGAYEFLKRFWRSECVRVAWPN